MSKKLVSRPNLDHLRAQAKQLLSELRGGSNIAISTIRSHVPSASELTPREILSRDWRLADAQLAIAKQSGFASWPKLFTHVETLRSLEGTWHFESLEVAGNPIASAMLTGSRILIDGDLFRSESAGTIYEGIFVIDVEPEIATIDIKFMEGPEAGNTNYGIFRLQGSKLDICLDMYGKERPSRFETCEGTGQAFERLFRHDASRPNNVTGGRSKTMPSPMDLEVETTIDFEFVPSATMERIQGEWTSQKVISDGVALPAAMVKSGARIAMRNELNVKFGGQTMIDALFRIDESKCPIAVDYLHRTGGMAGKRQLGILAIDENTLIVNMAAPECPRPTDFESRKGSMQTLSCWHLRTS